MLAARYHRAFNDREFNIWRAVLDDDVELIIDGDSFHGVDAAVGYGVGTVSRSPRLYITSDRVVAESDDTVVTEISLTNDDPDTGRVGQRGTAYEICRVRKGRIVSLYSYSSLGMAQTGTDDQALTEELAVLRRVAALVGRAARPDELFAAVVEEAGRLLHVDFLILSRYETEATQVSVGAWSRAGGDVPFPVGTRVRLGGHDVVSLVMRTGRPARIDDYSAASGEVADAARAWGMHAAIGVPISVAGRLWGVMAAASSQQEPLPPDTEQRVAGLTELIAAAVANADARSELRSHAEEQEALRRVATLVASGAPPDDVFAAVAAEVGRLLVVDMAALVRYDPDDAITVVGTWTITGAAAPTPVGTRLPLGGRNVTTLVFETRGPARIEYDEVSGAIGAAAAHDWRLRLSLGVPINVEGGLWGAMVVAFAREGVLPGDAEARLAGFTELVATALANAQARVELRGFGEEQAALRRVATQVASGKPPEDLFAAVAAEVGQMLGSDVTNLARYDPDGTTTVVGNWTRTGAAPPNPVGMNTRVGGRNVTSLVRETGQPARLDDYAGASGPVGEFSRSVGVRSAVGVPITVEGGLWGVMIVAATDGGPLPADAETRLAGFTELVGTAIANAQARMELRGFADEQAALRRVATLVARSAAPDELFAAVTAEVGQLLGADLTSLSRCDPDGVRTRVAAWSRTGAVPLPLGARVPLTGDDVAALVYRTSRPARVDGEGDASDPLSIVARAAGIRSSVAVPISVEGPLWGVMIVASQREQPLPPETEARLAGFTELVATAIANAEAQTALANSRARIVAAADSARRRIERDLHDGAQQRLVSLALRLRRPVREAAPPDAGELSEQLDDVAAELGDVLGELRELARGLHPAVLAAGGLLPALKTLARRSAVPVRLDVRIASRLPEPIELAAYYVVAETLTNVAKHARATVVDVLAYTVDERLRVEIRDDGCGGADPARGSGLVGLSDRVEALGGRLTVTSPSGAGTNVEVALPLTTIGNRALLR
jgi:GAF domain-containing protein